MPNTAQPQQDADPQSSPELSSTTSPAGRAGAAAAPVLALARLGVREAPRTRVAFAPALELAPWVEGPGSMTSSHTSLWPASKQPKTCILLRQPERYGQPLKALVRKATHRALAGRRTASTSDSNLSRRQ